MKDFSELDIAILRRIGERPCTFTSINARVTTMAALYVATKYGSPSRVVDRRLQALRKKGLIRFDTGRWFPVEGAALDRTTRTK